MKIGSKLLIACSTLMLLIACSATQTNDIDKAAWLIGTWENKTPDGSVYESWKKTSDKEFSGMSYIIEDEDTVVFETIRLVQEEGKLVYIPTASGENDGKPIRFALKEISDSKLIFENPKHDFPQMIRYTIKSENSLVAEISGILNGKKTKYSFPMKRLK